MRGVAREIVLRLKSHLGLKLALTVGLACTLVGPYYLLQRTREAAAYVMPRTALDDAIPYGERWVWVYLTLYGLMLVPPFLAIRREALRRFAVSFVTLCAVSHTIFLILPTAIAKTGIPASNAGMALVLAFDGQANAIPSLHASLAVLSALCAPALFGARRGLHTFAATMWVWAAAIVFSTLPTRRHVIADVAAGTALAFVVYALVGRTPRANAERPHVAPRSRTTLAARKLVARGREAQIAELARLDRKRRVVDAASFGFVWIAGASITMFGVASGGVKGIVARVGGTILSAVALNAFVLLLHEAMHGTLLAGRRANRVAGLALGAVAAISFTAYRIMHGRHHRYLGDPRDPDDYANYTSKSALVWALHFVRLAVGTPLYLFLIPAFALRHASADERRSIAVDYVAMFAIYALVAWFVAGSLVLHLWAIPALVVAYFTAVRGFTQHGLTPASDPFLASRSLAPRRIVAFCMLNENLHLEHHLFPEVPSYNLERLHALLADRIPYRVGGRSYAGFLLAFLRALPSMDERPVGLSVRQRQ